MEEKAIEEAAVAWVDALYSGYDASHGWVERTDEGWWAEVSVVDAGPEDGDGNDDVVHMEGDIGGFEVRMDLDEDGRVTAAELPDTYGLVFEKALRAWLEDTVGGTSFGIRDLVIRRTSEGWSGSFASDRGGVGGTGRVTFDEAWNVVEGAWEPNADDDLQDRLLEEASTALDHFIEAGLDGPDVTCHGLFAEEWRELFGGPGLTADIDEVWSLDRNADDDGWRCSVTVHVTGDPTDRPADDVVRKHLQPEARGQLSLDASEDGSLDEASFTLYLQEQAAKRALQELILEALRRVDPYQEARRVELKWLTDRTDDAWTFVFEYDPGDAAPGWPERRHQKETSYPRGEATVDREGNVAGLELEDRP